MADERAEPESKRTLESMSAQPDGKKTVEVSQLEVVKAQLDRVLQGIEAQRVATSEQKVATERGFTEVRGDLETVKAEGQRTNLRLTRQEVRMDDVETRLTNNSLRARTASEVDLDHESKLGLALAAAEEERTKREALEKTAATKDELKVIAQSVADAQTNAIGTLIADAAKSKMGQRLLQAAGVLLLAAMGTAGGYLARGNVQPPPPTIIQVAPVAAVDGGAR